MTIAKQLTGVLSIVEDRFEKGLEDENEALILTEMTVGVPGSHASYWSSSRWKARVH